MIKDKINYGIAIKQLNGWTKEYDEGRPIISDREWDNLYFEVKEFEDKTGIVFDDSPTQKVSYEIVNELKKVKHNHSMLSLDKTKNVDDLKIKFNNIDWIAMAKMDGLTCSLWYKNGKLYRAETRGNGEVGEDVTHNAKVIENIPKEIDIVDQDAIVDGEMICTYKNFEKFKEDYKNPRNFASGSIRLLDSKECSKRNLSFIAWDCIAGLSGVKTLSEKLERLTSLGFNIVPFGTSDPVSCDRDYQFAIETIRERAAHFSFPIDGVVFKINNCADYAAAGETSHHPSAAIAYKFYDEEVETELTGIEWSMGRTGQISPIALFKKVNINGTEVSKASLSNLSIMEATLGKHPFIGQKIYVSKRNQIIPKIERAKDENGKWIMNDWLN